MINVIEPDDVVLAQIAANLHLDQLNQDGSNLSAIATTDAGPTTCTLPALSAVTLP